MANGSYLSKKARANAKLMKYSTEVVSKLEQKPALQGIDYKLSTFVDPTFELTQAREKLFKEFEEEVLLPEVQRAKEAKVVNLLLQAYNEIVVLEGFAKQLNKDVRELTEEEAVQAQLETRDEFVRELQMDKQVLFSNTTALEKFRQFKTEFLSLYTSTHPAPKWLVDNLNEQEAKFDRLSKNEIVTELVVDEDVYDRVKERVFPTLLDKGVTPKEIIDFCGGFSDSLLVTSNARAKPFVDLLLSIRDPKASEKERSEKLAELSELLQGEHYNRSIAYLNKEDNATLTNEDNVYIQSKVYAKSLQNRAHESLSHKIGRIFKQGDLFPERRLVAGALDVHHPLLEEERTVYLHGENTEPDLVTDDKYPTVTFTPKDNFNPPTHFRPLTSEQLEENPELKKELQVAALDFAYFEGEDVIKPINASETVVNMKLWKFFKYLIPELYSSPEQRQNFLEHFDISPGELTLEWTLSFPPKEHTFLEFPLWTHVYEIDEETDPVMWPYYNVRYIKSKVLHQEGSIEDEHHTLKVLGELAGTKAVAKEVATSWPTLNKEEKTELLQYISPFYSQKTITEEDLENIDSAMQNFLDKKTNEHFFQERLHLIEEEFKKLEEKEDKDIVEALYRNRVEETEDVLNKFQPKKQNKKIEEPKK